MRYREVGKTGISVSEIGFGAEWIDKTDPDSARALAARCAEEGIDIVDCWMADPDMRSALGYALDGMRDRWVIQGHLGSTWQDGQYKRTRDLELVKPAFEDLLKRLCTDHVEFGMLHYIDDRDDYDRAMDGGLLDYALELKSQGVIGHIGMSTHNPAIALAAAESGVVEMLMFSCNPAFDLQPADVALDGFFDGSVFKDSTLSNISPDRAHLYATCEAAGIGITVMKGFAGGRLLNAKDSPFGVALSVVQCLNYALTRPAVASVLAGFSKVEQVADATAFEDAAPADLDYASVLATAPSHAFSGQCTYCGHCAPCPEGIEVSLVNKFADLATMQEEIPASVAGHYAELKAHAGDCIGCRQCEKRCPFGVPVVERMAEIEALFGL